MPIKTRAPKDLGIDDFISFVRQLLLWLAGQVGDPDYRATLVDGLQAKFDALEAKFLEYKQLKIHVPEKNELYTNAADALHKGLSMLKGLLLSFFDDPDIHGFFGLANPIPTDLDELYSTGQVCFDQWATVSADPEYADVAPDFADVLVLFNDFVIKRDEYEAKFQAMQAAQNDMEELRAEIEEQERDLFNYYRSKHPKGDDPWWTDTPWGGTGEPEPGVEGEPPVGEWPSAPSEVGAELITDPSTFMRVYYTIPGGSDSVSIYRAVVPHGDPAPERPASPYTTEIGSEQYADTDIEAGNDYYYWVCGVQGGEEGDFAGPAMCEV